ncbi:MAG TPA: hypothetical protein VIH93_12235 [Thermoanaerobaculia bacterium]|jgi:hypothetical protein
MAGRAQRFLVVYSFVVTALFAATVLAGLASPAKRASFDEIDVHRINVVEPDGTLRLVISDHARLPGIIVRGKERPFSRPQAGMLFFNDEGSENGGLIFGGRRNARGEVVDSGGSLTFDRYEANQIVQLLGVDDKEDRIAGLAVGDSPTGSEVHRRVWVGRGEDGAATVALMDARGKKRLILQVTADGAPSLSLLDASGQVVRRIDPTEGRPPA